LWRRGSFARAGRGLGRCSARSECRSKVRESSQTCNQPNPPTRPLGSARTVECDGNVSN
jgi:hypothetical protein